MTDVAYAFGRMMQTLWRSLEILALLVCAWMVLPYAAGVAHGKLFPVVAFPAQITKVDPVDLTHTLVWGKTVRRQDCDFNRMEWFYGRRDGSSTRLDVRLLEPPKIRPTGDMEFGPWELQAPQWLVREHTFANVRHCNCRVELLRYPVTLPWCVWSKFY